MVDLLKPSPNWDFLDFPQGIVPLSHCPRRERRRDANALFQRFQRQRIGWHLLETGEVRMVKEPPYAGDIVRLDWIGLDWIGLEEDVNLLLTEVK